MEGAQDKMASFTGIEGCFHGFAVSDFPHKNDFGRLAHGGAHACMEAEEVSPQLALAEGGFDGSVNKFDGVFESEDMYLAVLVDFVEHGSDGSRLAHSRTAGHKDDACGFLDDFVENGFQAERLERWDLGFEMAHDHGVIAVLEINVHAET